MTLKEKILARLEQLESGAKRSLGQNFLISERVVHEILEEIRRVPPAQLVEVGPGLGALTDDLLDTKIPLTLIELDRKFSQYWRDRNCIVIEGDALKLNWDQLQIPEQTCFVSNLPYQIAARIMIERCLGPKNVGKMILMMQLEVAERAMASSGSDDYGFLSVVIQSFWQVRRLTDAGPQDFWPRPKVDSRILIFMRRNTDLENSFIQFVKKAFENRRKFMLKNFPEEREGLLQELQKMGFDEKVRAEELSVSDFQNLYRSVIKS